MRNGKKDDENKLDVSAFYYKGLVILKNFRVNWCLDLTIDPLSRGIEGQLLEDIQEAYASENYIEVLQALAKLEYCITSRLSKYDIIKYVAYVAKYGAEKYGLYNYRELSFKRVYLALGRHYLSFTFCPELLDVDTGVEHVYHTLANIYMLAVIVNNKIKGE